MLLDFYHPRQKHLFFTIKLKAYLLELQEINTEDVVKHDRCDLGHWIYDFGMELYKNLPEMQELEHKHVQFHQIVKEIIDYKQNNETHKALETFEILLKKSEEILELLRILEDIINN